MRFLHSTTAHIRFAARILWCKVHLILTSLQIRLKKDHLYCKSFSFHWIKDKKSTTPSSLVFPPFVYGGDFPHEKHSTWKANPSSATFSLFGTTAFLHLTSPSSSAILMNNVHTPWRVFNCFKKFFLPPHSEGKKNQQNLSHESIFASPSPSCSCLLRMEGLLGALRGRQTWKKSLIFLKAVFQTGAF